MKLGVFTVLFQQLSLDDALDTIRAAGFRPSRSAAEGIQARPTVSRRALLADAGKLAAFKHAIDSRGLSLSALSCHANPLHPQAPIAREAHASFEQAVLLAERLGVDRVVLFSGCPGDSDQARYPNWVTAAWPTEFQDLLAWQWTEKVIPYWRTAAGFARDHGVRLCFELHPNFVVYNPATLLRLRAECGDNIGANLDPSHLFWQGIDVIEAIHALGKAQAIYHVHAKDTAIDQHNAAVNGVLDTRPSTRSPTARGSSAPSATGTTSCSGAGLSRPCARLATTTC